MSAQPEQKSDRRITVDEYYRMKEEGLIAPGIWTELIDGVVMDRGPMGAPHGGALALINQLLVQATAGRAITRVQVFREPCETGYRQLLEPGAPRALGIGALQDATIYFLWLAD